MLAALLCNFQPLPNGPGRIKWKPRTIKRSEFVHQREYEEAVKSALQIVEFSAPISEPEDDDDDMILMALARLIH